MTPLGRLKHLPAVKYFCSNWGTYEVILCERTRNGEYAYLETLK